MCNVDFLRAGFPVLVSQSKQVCQLGGNGQLRRQRRQMPLTRLLWGLLRGVSGAPRILTLHVPSFLNVHHANEERAQCFPQPWGQPRPSLPLSLTTRSKAVRAEAWSVSQGGRGQSAGGSLQGRGAPLTQHKNVYFDHQCLLVVGDDAFPGATLLPS